ncbi:MAG: hypothetical protein WDA53_02175 [Bacillota bacterium]
MTIFIRLKPFLAALVVLLVSYAGYYYWENYLKIIPEELLAKTTEKLTAVENYRYKVELKLIANGQERNISDVEGERKGEEGFHLSGVIQGTPIEAYHINNITYLKAGEKGKWMTIPGNRVFEQDLFMVEIDPLASLNFIKVDNLVYAGRVNYKGQKLHQLSFAPELEHPFMNKHWFGFQYTLWLKTNGELVKGEVAANLKARPEDRFYLTIEITDYHAKIQLEPPIQ